MGTEIEFGDADLLDATTSPVDEVDPEIVANLEAVATFKATEAGF